MPKKNAKKAKYVWMRVTNDKYELPVFIADSPQELAKMVGCQVANIRCQLSKQKHKGQNSVYKKVRIG